MNKFGFIAHPINIKAFYDFLGVWRIFGKLLSEKTIRNIAKKTSPYPLCSFRKIKSFTGSIISGDIVLIPLLPIEIVTLTEEKVLELVEKSINMCERNGAKVVGLGGFTSVVGNEGEYLSKRVEVPLTSGNTLTAALALEGIYKATHIMDVSLSDSTAAVIGATGDVGSICTKILARKVKKINIAARNEQKLQEFANSIKNYGKVNVEIFKYTKDAVRNADIVLTATSAVTTIIDPKQLKSGAIICDVAIPANIAREVVQMRKDILVFEGGLAKIAYPEDVRNKKLLHLVPGNAVYGCVAETIALTFERRFESYSIGRGNITEEKIDEIKSIAAKHGIVLSDFFCGDKFFSQKDIENIKTNSEKGKIYAS